ncbi:MAG: hypothetical protein ACFB3T_11405 [Geminicoccaceae bacterium]
MADGGKEDFTFGSMEIGVLVLLLVLIVSPFIFGFVAWVVIGLIGTIALMYLIVQLTLDPRQSMPKD